MNLYWLAGAAACGSVLVAIIFLRWLSRARVRSAEDAADTGMSDLEVASSSDASSRDFASVLTAQSAQAEGMPSADDSAVAQQAFSQGGDDPAAADQAAEVVSALGQAAVAAARDVEEAEPADQYQQTSQWSQIVQDSFQKRISKSAVSTRRRPYRQDLLIINIIARPGFVFQGEAIATALVAQGLRLSDQGIFEQRDQDGVLYFSVASLVAPGTFPSVSRGQFTTPGLSCFMNLSAAAAHKQVFKSMLALCHDVAHQLGGELFDESRQRLKQSSIEDYLQRIKTSQAAEAAAYADV